MPAAVDIYTTIAGDTWDGIAFKVYGDALLFTALMAANPAHRRTVRFGAGTRLACPDIVISGSSTLPPWVTA